MLGAWGLRDAAGGNFKLRTGGIDDRERGGSVLYGVASSPERKRA